MGRVAGFGRATKLQMKRRKVVIFIILNRLTDVG